MPSQEPELPAHDRLRGKTAYHRHGLYLGLTESDGFVFAPPEHGALVCGPPRSGKTAGIMIPNVLAACGPVVSTSTKPDVMHITAPARLGVGECYLFDPTGTTKRPPYVTPLGWSPLLAAREWDGAVRVADVISRAARPDGHVGNSAHWVQKGRQILSLAFYAGASGACSYEDVEAMIHRRDLEMLTRPISARKDKRRLNEIEGFQLTHPEEMSGIWSTAAALLDGYRTDAAFRTTQGEMLDADKFISGANTLYVCGGGQEQGLAGPILSALINDVKTAAYAKARERDPQAAPEAPLTLLLDEVANIAPLPDLPAIVADGGSQGVVTLACFQDLRQAKGRWPGEAEAFLSTFQSKVILGRYTDEETLDAICGLAGTREVVQTSTTRVKPSVFRRSPPPSITTSTSREPILRKEEIAQCSPGRAFWLDGVRPGWLKTPIWPAVRLFSETVTQSREWVHDLAAENPGWLGLEKAVDTSRQRHERGLSR